MELRLPARRPDCTLIALGSSADHGTSAARQRMRARGEVHESDFAASVAALVRVMHPAGFACTQGGQTKSGGRRRLRPCERTWDRPQNRARGTAGIGREPAIHKPCAGEPRIGVAGGLVKRHACCPALRPEMPRHLAVPSFQRRIRLAQSGKIGPCRRARQPYGRACSVRFRRRLAQPHYRARRTAA
jgi:hypothetical protein